VEISENIWKYVKKIGKIWKYMATGGGLAKETAAKHRKSLKARWAVLDLSNSSSSFRVQVLLVDADHDLARKKPTHEWRQAYTS